MTPIQEDALGIALIACSLGALICRAEVASMRRKKPARPSRRFEIEFAYWRRLSWTFGIGALTLACWWALIKLAMPS